MSSAEASFSQSVFCSIRLHQKWMRIHRITQQHINSIHPKTVCVSIRTAPTYETFSLACSSCSSCFSCSSGSSEETNGHVCATGPMYDRQSMSNLSKRPSQSSASCMTACITKTIRQVIQFVLNSMPFRGKSSIIIRLGY